MGKRVPVHDEGGEKIVGSFDPDECTIWGREKTRRGKSEVSLYRAASGLWIFHIHTPTGLKQDEAWLMSDLEAGEWLSKRQLPLPEDLDLDHLRRADDISGLTPAGESTDKYQQFLGKALDHFKIPSERRPAILKRREWWAKFIVAYLAENGRRGPASILDWWIANDLPGYSDSPSESERRKAIEAIKKQMKRGREAAAQLRRKQPSKGKKSN